MAIKEIQIHQLPEVDKITNENVFVVEVGTTTYKVTGQTLINFIKTHSEIKNIYIDKELIGVNNGVVPINSDGKIDSQYIQYGEVNGTAYEGSSGKALENELITHKQDSSNPHGVDKEQVGLGNVENKSSEDIRDELSFENVTKALGFTPEVDGTYEQATAYTDKAIADLIGGAEEDLNTLKELSDAIKESKSVVEALNEAIGKKANEAEFDSHVKDTAVHLSSTDRESITTSLEHSKSEHARYDATKTERSTTNGNLKINGTETAVYQHPLSGVTPGTYRQVIVDSEGHVTGGNNTTLPLTQGGTGATTAAQALSNLGLSATAEELNKLDGATVSVTEINQLKGVTSPVQNQLDGKAPTLHGNHIPDVTSDSTGAVMMSDGESYSWQKLGKQDIVDALGYVPGTGSIVYTSVKGDAETEYRTGEVNITKENIGLGKVDNTSDNEKSVLSASKLSNVRKIGNASFDGTKDITLKETGALDPIGDEFNSSLTYVVGDFCIYNNALYKCTTAIDTAGEWDESKWEVTTVTTELSNTNISNLLNNKTIVFLGDSITVGLGWQNEIGDTTNKYGWAKIIQEHFTTATVKNLAVSGACIANTGNYIDVISQYFAMSNTELPDYYTPNPDYIIFSGGGNDGLNSVSMGTICDGFAPAYENINTTIGALEYMFANAYNAYPTAKKGFIITHRLTDAVEEYYDAIRNVCQKWSIPVLDLSRVGEINAFIDGIATTYFSKNDRVHPNEKCYREILAPKVEEWLISGFINSSSSDPTALKGKIINGTLTASSSSVSTLPYKFIIGSAVVLNNEIHILGSAYDSRDTNNYTKHYKWDGTSWTEVSTLPYNFYGASAVVLNNEIHILGSGHDSRDTNNYTKHYKWDGTSWTSVSTLPYIFSNGSAVVLNNEIHILGCGDDNPNKHYKWDGTSWTSVSTLPYNFIAGSAVVYNNEIHILGSAIDSNTYTKHYKWDGTSWTSVSTLPYAFYQASAVVYNNEIHILGSADNSDTNNYTKHYKWDGTSWTSVSTLPYNFYGGSAVVYNNEIHILGSADNSISSATYTNHYKIDTGQSTLTLTDSAIKEDSILDIYVSQYGVSPTSVTSEVGSITLTFGKLDNDLNVKVVIM